MVLLVSGLELYSPPESVERIYQQFPRLRQTAEKLANKPPKCVEPTGVMYVRQKQWGVTYPEDKLDNGDKVICCGTEDVLTCHVIIIRDPYTGVSSIAHFDEFSKQSSFEKMVESFLEKIRERQEGDWEYWEEGAEGDWEYWESDDENYEEESVDPVKKESDAVYELYIVGGYNDDAGKAKKISRRFFKHLHDLKVRLNLVVCCLWEPNTRRYKDGPAQPKISGLCLDVNTGIIESAVFNRTFTDFSDGIRDLLLCFPPLIKNKSTLKQMIARQEDRGYGKAQVLCV
ncbi:uncharacterized protein LOC111696928 isoform X2 [Eurytemora carolleeae]|nr:uncharacterized protein LOC111696928 isoform X2 [Eurytemora carolleeae]XP_023322490.1 uncharacterized protein LOC111696928 isoform X2 [Eurytemora carolleeae]XP_023322491.1 uncharacterized protein LOC111696928 isoform X2 [Eurytemora carolleeae]XP_023322492.1 uncharacterized protein LOC111696928 isoform X2 [Eurytemora carolleeae]|eukprot:XP_023322489.1 uncharacterized protein LOC111696928 isoform X2 [Eurytemora affinis]